MNYTVACDFLSRLNNHFVRNYSYIILSYFLFFNNHLLDFLDAFDMIYNDYTKIAIAGLCLRKPKDEIMKWSRFFTFGNNSGEA